jgi:hypothetical protein
VGLVPSAALLGVAVSALQLTLFTRDQILEARLGEEVEKLKSGEVEK